MYVMHQRYMIQTSTPGRTCLEEIIGMYISTGCLYVRNASTIYEPNFNTWSYISRGRRTRIFGSSWPSMVKITWLSDAKKAKEFYNEELVWKIFVTHDWPPDEAHLSAGHKLFGWRQRTFPSDNLTHFLTRFGIQIIQGCKDPLSLSQDVAHLLYLSSHRRILSS